ATQFRLRTRLEHGFCGRERTYETEIPGNIACTEPRKSTKKRRAQCRVALLGRNFRPAHPITELIARFTGESCESQTANFLDFICPNQFAAHVNAVVLLLQRKAHSSIRLDRIHRMKCQSVAGHIQHNAAIVRFDVDVRESVQFRAWITAALIWKHGTPMV